MNNNFFLIIASEMVLINSLTVHLVSRRKFTTGRTLGILGLFSLGMILVLSSFMSKNYLEAHRGVELLCGFLYLVPCAHLYKQSFKYTLAICCTSWLYNVFFFTLSIRIAILFKPEWYGWACVAALTLFFFLTYVRFMDSLRKVVQVLRTINDETLTILCYLGVLWLITCIILNIIFTGYNRIWLELLVTLSLMLCIYLSYKVFYSLVNLSSKARELKIRTETDPLTGLKNRQAFLNDAQKLMDKKRPFSIVFIDLDHFKQVNDSYGHEVGDEYLRHFARVVCRYYQGMGTLYRLSGDEFVFLYFGQNVKQFCDELEAKVTSTYQGRIPFHGLSMGYASYPADGTVLSQLLRMADLKMYQEKKKKHIDKT